jgi:glucose/arabinose dehydrogenase
MRRSWVWITVFVAACGSGTPPPPSTGPGSGTTESITGRERIGWDQPAADSGELSTFRYAIYVDGARAEIADVTCAPNAASTGFSCNGKLPSMSNGAHTLELATFSAVNADSGESAKSPPLQVVVTGLTAPANSQTADWQSGDLNPTRDGLRLHLDRIAEGLDHPTDAAFAPDGRLFITERTGRIRVVADGRMQDADALLLPDDDEGTRQAALSIAFDPDFANTHLVFVTHTAESADGPTIRLSRYRELRGTLGERASLFQSLSDDASTASAVARFGPDRKVYLAASGDESGGRLFRLNADGTLPRDQAGTTPAVAAGVQAAHGMGWDPRSGVLWIADDDVEAAHLSAVSMTAPPIRAIIRGRRAVEPGVGSMTFYTSDAIREMRNDALIASARGYVLRVHFAQDDATRVERSERLLEDRVGPIRVVTVGPEGAIYFCTDTAVGRLSPSRF